MTATEKTVAILRERGQMTPGEFARLAWPHVWANAQDKRKVEANAGVFLTRLARKGRIRKEGRKYDVRAM